MKKLAEPGIRIAEESLAICIPVSNTLNNCRVSVPFSRGLCVSAKYRSQPDVGSVLTQIRFTQRAQKLIRKGRRKLLSSQSIAKKILGPNADTAGVKK